MNAIHLRSTSTVIFVGRILHNVKPWIPCEKETPKTLGSITERLSSGPSGGV